MLGVFVSMDMILFYSFFELTLIPMAVMIFIWGGSNRNYAAIKFFLYTFAGSVFMLIGIITLYLLNLSATGTTHFGNVGVWGGATNFTTVGTAASTCSSAAW